MGNQVGRLRAYYSTNLVRILLRRCQRGDNQIACRKSKQLTGITVNNNPGIMGLGRGHEEIEANITRIGRSRITSTGM